MSPEPAAEGRYPNSHTERTQCAPWGIFGGQDALPNRISVGHVDGTVEIFPSGKTSARKMVGGEALIIESGGGGGYGPPWERPAERVQHDVVEGYVTIEAAARRYGVVLDPQTLAINHSATAARRRELAAAP